MAVQSTSNLIAKKINLVFIRVFRQNPLCVRRMKHDRVRIEVDDVRRKIRAFVFGHIDLRVNDVGKDRLKRIDE